MQSNLVSFIQVLRTHDVRVSPAETLDAMTVATTLGYADRSLLRDGLAMTLAKTPEEEAIWGGTAGDQLDPCYHLACDTFDNISLKALEVNSDAVAFATLKYVMSTETINGIRGKGNFKERKLAKDAAMGKFEYRGNRLQR